MVQDAESKQHLVQIEAGIIGRKRGHYFEQYLTEMLDNPSILNNTNLYQPARGHLFTGNPAILLLQYIIDRAGIDKISAIQSWWVGALATSGEGDRLCDENGNIVSKCKSDIVLKISLSHKEVFTVGVSTKTCNNNTPTNAQLFFTTASAFCDLLQENGIKSSSKARNALRMFCGDVGFRPLDRAGATKGRLSNPERWFWEELPRKGREELEAIFSRYQDRITRLLLQKAYSDDPFPPDYLLHQTKACDDLQACENAIFSMEELIKHSREYARFETRPYTINKGRYKSDPSTHLAPRFGFVQMQRGGQKQHPTQLQFNLRAGYFYDIGDCSCR